MSLVFLSQLFDEFSLYRHSMSINITLKYAFSLKNIILNYLTHITEFIYPLLEKKLYKRNSTGYKSAH